MKILALDSSGLVASVAIVEDDDLIAEYDIQYKKTHSQTLLPMLDEIKKNDRFGYVCVGCGGSCRRAGSFTGLRIGSARRKAWACLGIPLIEIPTLEGLAYNLYGQENISARLWMPEGAGIHGGL
nr:tRNA threonylcarbamoyladenosine biosynthesis protein TsaB [Kineothrix alysoides]